MKNFRKAAIAVAAASTVAFAGTAVASAQDAEQTTAPSIELPGVLSSDDKADEEQGQGIESSIELPDFAGSLENNGEETEGDDEAPAETPGGSSENEGGAKSGDPLYFGGILAKIGKLLQADQGINGYELFGSAQSEFQSAWSQLFKFGSIALLLGAIASAAGFALNR